jgi:hypothetical protein
MSLQTDLAVLVGQCMATRTNARVMVDKYGHPEGFGYLNNFVEQMQAKLEQLMSREVTNDTRKEAKV